ncbi:MAG TPA: thioesterase family protein [Bacillota bacterium]|nr:thioesterase family protein [Bacillota bacterium]HQE66495.1 thioesterase family protein [Bacillota bacterium]HQJ37596.1 thioesterase family protein [Bacillota bacterium]HQL36916.1 thioesterase family protein [Bacillota bacterium]
MDNNLKIGMTAQAGKIVSEDDTAVKFGSGGVRVFATPMMVALMENAALNAVDPHLGEDSATVGLSLNVKHLAATPVGMKVTAVAELISIEGKKLTFKVEAYDEQEKIGEGIHERYIIKLSKFLERAAQKSSKLL